MTQTKKQRTIAEQVASESPYQRAAARWVAERTGGNPDLICEVDFYRTDCDRSDAGTYWEGEFGLSYKYRGIQKTYDFSGLVTPGQFIEECVVLLDGISPE
jgi:hypothetical protein